MTHELKIWPEHFERVVDGTKTFEIRKNDRAFQRGDRVKLLDWDPWRHENSLDPYSGAYVLAEIGDVYPIDSERVVFSLLKVEHYK